MVPMVTDELAVVSLALVCVSDGDLDPAIRYLEHCVFTLHNNDRSIHNFLISVYAKSSASQDHKKLLDYLVIQSREVPVWA